MGTALVAAGALLIGIFGAIPEPNHTLDELLLLLARHHFIIWMVGTLIGVGFLLSANWLLKRIYPRATPRLRLVRGILFGCVSGILSAHTLLIAKSAVELLVRTIIDRHNQFNRWQSWMILIGLVVFGLTQLYYLHQGLKLCSTSVLYPLVFCVYNIIAIVDGLIYFHQSSKLSALQTGLIALGTVILLAGVVSLSWRLEEPAEEPTSPLATKPQRAPLPQNALTPGMALVHGTLEEEDESPIDIDEMEPGIHGAITDHQRQTRVTADERSPLLARFPTGPPVVIARRSKKRPSIDTTSHVKARASPSPRLPYGRRRSLTVAQDAEEIWDELNDRENMLSPRRSDDLERRPRSGTLPARRKNSSSSTWLNQMRRSSWWGRSTNDSRRASGSTSQGKKPVDAATSLLQTTDSDDHQSDTDGELRPGVERSRGSWGMGNNSGGKPQQGAADWFKMKWWPRKRRKDESRDDRDEEQGV